MSLLWLKAMIKAVDLEKRTVEGFASTKQPDIIRDVILPKAWKKSLARWKKRGSIPKFLAYHMHRLLTGHSPVLGPMLKLRVTQEGLVLKAEFAETELGDEHLHLYSIGAMDYFSVGFNIMRNGFTMDLDEIRELLRDNGIQAKVPEECDRVIYDAELFEVSAVVIGANLGALVTASAEGACGLCGEGCAGKCKTDEDRAMRSKYARTILERLEKCAHIIPDGSGAAVHADPEKLVAETEIDIKAFLSDQDLKDVEVEEEEGIDELVHPKLFPLPELTEETATEVRTAGVSDISENDLADPLLVEKRVIPYKDYGFVTDESAAWNGPAQIRQAEPPLLKQICAWYNAESPDVKSSYKLPHHLASDKKAVWRGVSAAMGALLGARGGVDIPSNEKRGVYNHLARHYSHWEKEPPEFREYTSEELKDLEEKGVLLTTETVAAETRALDSQMVADIFEGMKSLEARTEKLEKGLESVEKSLDLIRTATVEPGKSGDEKSQTDDATEEAKGAEDEVDGVPVLKAVLENLEKAAGK